MYTASKKHGVPPRTAALILAFAATAIAVAPLPAAIAGECPAGKQGTDVMKPGAKSGAMTPKGVTDTVIAAIDLSHQGPEYGGRLFRMRKLIIAPGGVVPWHGHAERPANIYILSGTVTEYRSTCAVPIVHRAGEVVAESGDLSHWWKNTSKKPAVLLSADILPPAMKDDHTM